MTEHKGPGRDELLDALYNAAHGRINEFVEAKASLQEAASHADPRTTMRYDRGRQSLDRRATYIVATFIAGASR